MVIFFTSKLADPLRAWKKVNKIQNLLASTIFSAFLGIEPILVRKKIVSEDQKTLARLIIGEKNVLILTHKVPTHGFKNRNGFIIWPRGRHMATLKSNFCVI